MLPGYLKVSFAVGGLAFLGAVLYTVLTTKEYPPEDIVAFNKMKAESTGVGHLFKEVFSTLFDLPKVMKQLAIVQFFSWLGLFLMWFYLTPAIAVHIFDAPNPQSEAYAQGLAWANICMGFYSVITSIFALFMPALADKFGKKNLHSICLAIGGISLIMLFAAHDKYMLLINMIGLGIAWTSILAMPYSILAGSLDPRKMGLFMGIFNFFIVLPEIMAALFFGWVMATVLDNNRLSAVVLGGAMLVIAAVAALFVNDKTVDYSGEL